jgi:thiol-disulfide isomerase/thioredoxin
MRAVVVHWLSALACACAAFACNERPKLTERSDSHPAATQRNVNAAPVASKRAEPSGDKPVIVSGQLPVAAFVAEELASAPANRVTLVSVSAAWCEPCQRFHRALAAGELDKELPGFRFIEYDFDAAGEGLVAAGYRPKLIPLFALPKPDGTASGKKVEGAIKGDGAVSYIVPRLLELGRRP